MSQIGQIYYRIPGDYTDGTDGYISNITSDALYSDVLGTVGATKFTKVGVQAPPGTQMVLNNIKYIMIGRTGIYELDEDVAITQLKFIKPKTYTENVDKTAANEADGQADMDKAKTKFEEETAGLSEYSSTYNDALERYQEAHAAGYALSQTKVYDATDGDLQGVIIDFIWE